MQMSACHHIMLLASYNTWMNRKLYAAAAGLSSEEWAADRQAFFGSLRGTFNHILVADIIWLKRFATHPACDEVLMSVLHLPPPQSLNQILYSDFAELHSHRVLLDNVIEQWAAALAEADLDLVLHYSNTKGIEFARRFSSLVMHFFNHQTHHRGQATTLLSQAGVDVGITDLLELIPTEHES